MLRFRVALMLLLMAAPLIADGVPRTPEADLEGLLESYTSTPTVKKAKKSKRPCRGNTLRSRSRTRSAAARII